MCNYNPSWIITIKVERFDWVMLPKIIDKKRVWALGAMVSATDCIQSIKTE